MPGTTTVVVYLTDIIFLTTNIILLHIFLTPKRSYWIQGIAFTVTGFSVHWLRILMEPLAHNFLLRGFITGPLYLIPCALLFKETFPAIVFVFFLIYSMTQFIYLIFMHIDQFLSPAIPGTWVLLGLFLEMLSLPLINKYVAPHIKNIIGIINKKNPSFTLFSVLSFILLAFYGVEGTYALATFIPLVLSTLLMLFSYYLIAKSIDQTKRQQKLEELELSSKLDSLTGLFNRRYMEQRIEEEYEKYRSTGSEFALVIGDIDFFKEVNDRFGHDCGDCLLKSVSEDLRNSIRASDIVARWGGEEFLLLLPATNAENAVRLAERISKTVEHRRYAYENAALSLTLTLGISVVSGDDTIASIIKKADIALYQGKRSGRNCVISFDDIANKVISETDNV